MSAPFDAFHLPVEVAGPFNTVRAGGLDCRYPEPDAARIAAVIAALRGAGDRLADRATEDIVRLIDAAAARLADPRDDLRRQAEALLPVATGYSPAMITLILDRMTADWRADPLRRLLDVELGGPDALDRSVPRGDGSRSMAFGPRLAFHVFSGNVPGVAVTSLVRALLVKAPSLGKLATGEPVLPVLFARALRSIDAEAADAVAVTYWPGGEPEPERVALEAADLVIVYGGEDAVTSLGSRARPGQRLILHGPKLSIGAIGAGPLDGGLDGAAERAATAVATFDQQGCVSPHAFWVEGPEERAAELADGIAGSLERLAASLPRGRITAAEASAIQQERGTAELRAHAGTGVRVWAGTGTAWTVVLEPGDRVHPSCLNRFVRVHPVDDLARLPALIEPLAGRIQSVALEGAGDRAADLARRLARVGATRITTLERLPWPGPHAHHDGAPPLRELLRWTDRET